MCIRDRASRARPIRTSVTIAHRLTTAENADEVIVFDKGRVVQRGPHDRLVAEGAPLVAFTLFFAAAPLVGLGLLAVGAGRRWFAEPPAG